MLALEQLAENWTFSAWGVVLSLRPPALARLWASRRPHCKVLSPDKFRAMIVQLL